MKRLIAFAVVCCLMLTCAAAEESLAARAGRLGAKLDVILKDTAYIDLLTGSAAIGDIVKAWGQEDHAVPGIILQVETASLADQMLQQAWQLSGEAKAELSRKMPMTLASQLNAAYGTETLAAASACAVSSVFAHGAQGSGLFIILYRESMPVFVSWYAENGAVHMQAMIVADEELAVCRNADDFNAWMQDQGMNLSWSMAE